MRSGDSMNECVGGLLKLGFWWCNWL